MVAMERMSMNGKDDSASIGSQVLIVVVVPATAAFARIFVAMETVSYLKSSW